MHTFMTIAASSQRKPIFPPELASLSGFRIALSRTEDANATEALSSKDIKARDFSEEANEDELVVMNCHGGAC